MHPNEYDLTSEDAIAHPEPVFEEMRKRCPVSYVEAMDTYMLARYDDVKAAMRDPLTFSSDRPFFGAGDSELEEIQASGYPQVPTLTMTDPPIHTRYRKLVNQAFSPKAVRALEPSMRRIVHDLIDGFVERGSVEFVSEFASLVPGYIIADALGLARGEQDRFMGWADDFVDSIQGREILSRERMLEIQHHVIDFQKFFANEIEKREQAPGDDLISALLAARVGGERPLDRPEILDLIRVFLTAGNETTASWISGTMRLLLSHRSQFEEVLADRNLIPAMLEESVRLVSPARWTRRTIVGRPVEMSGTVIPVGATVRPLWTSANRDEAYFPESATFDIHRDTSAHMAFGHGVHFCLGVNLARAEARIAFEVLFERLRDIRSAIPLDDVRTLPFVGVNRLSALPLRFAAT